MERETEQATWKSMPCASVNQRTEALEQEGWKYYWSFRTGSREQWNDTCDRVQNIIADGCWEAILVQGQNEEELRDGVAYIYIRRKEN